MPLELGPGGGDHVAVYRDLHGAIRGGGEVVADGREARMSLELANAMIASSRTGSEISFPLDREMYAAMLAELRKETP